mgnify:CR=1 FL=1
MKKKDIIQLVKNAIKENAYGHATLTTQGPPRTGAIAPAGKDPYTGEDEYPFSVRPKRTGTGMMESQSTLSSYMLDYADHVHMELVDTMKGVSTHPDKKTGGFRIIFPHYNGPNYTGAMFGKGVSDKIDASKAAAWNAALKTVEGFKTEIDDYDITDKSRAGVYGSIHLWIIPKSMDETTMNESEMTGQLAGDSSSTIASDLSDHVLKVLKQPNNSVTYLHLKHKEDGNKVTGMLAAKYGIKATVDKMMYAPSTTVRFDNDQMVTINTDYTEPKGGTYSSQYESSDEASSPVKIGDILHKGNKEGKVVKVMSDMANVDFGNGDVYGITFARIKGDQITEKTKNKMENKIKEADVSGLEKAAIEAEKKAIEMKIKALNDKKTKMSTGTDSVVEGDHEESMDDADIGMLNDLVQKYSPEKLKITIDILDRGTTIDSKFTKTRPDDEDDIEWETRADIDTMRERYMKERAGDNLMEHMDTYRKRAILMEGATEKLFKLFNAGKTDAEVRNQYLQMNIDMPESFVAKLRNNWESLRKTKLDLTLADKEAEGFNQLATPSVDAPPTTDGMEAPMEEKQLATGLKEI